jgi:flagellar protein FlaJ
MIKKKLSKQASTLIISLVISAFLFSVGIISKDVGVIGNVIILSTLIIVAPQLFFSYLKYREIKEMEEKFPHFVRNLIESINSGMPLHEAIKAASKVSYGKLSKEIKKMANQISWGMPVIEVLDDFAERVKKSRRLFSAIKIIKESYLSGGNVVSTLESVADNITILRDVEKERKSILDQYVLVMYAVSLIFIAIVIALNRLLIPVFKTTALAEGSLGLTNPCLQCQGMECSICALYQFTSQNIFSIDPESVAAHYSALFFFMSIVQSIFAGLIAGQVSENSIVAGFKHSLILACISLGAFSILARIGMLVI